MHCEWGKGFWVCCLFIYDLIDILMIYVFLFLCCLASRVDIPFKIYLLTLLFFLSILWFH